VAGATALLTRPAFDFFTAQVGDADGVVRAGLPLLDDAPEGVTGLHAAGVQGAFRYARRACFARWTGRSLVARITLVALVTLRTRLALGPFSTGCAWRTLFAGLAASTVFAILATAPEPNQCTDRN
jgi:hypothetical protein